MVSARLISFFAELQNPENRQAGACALASYLHVKRILIFNKDPESSTFLLTQGFKQRLDEPREWQQFLSDCAESGMSSKHFPDPATGKDVQVFGLSEKNGTCILVLFDGEVNEDELNALQILLPFLGHKLADERLILAITLDDTNKIDKSEKDRPQAVETQYDDLLASYERVTRQLIYHREAENKLRVADRRKDEFIATVSHELRTPLNAILGWAEVLRIKTTDNPHLLKGIETIIRNAKSQANLISELLDTSSIVAGKLVLHLEPVDLKEIIERARETVEPLAQQKSIQIQSNVTVKDMLNGDPTRLRQVFWNLLCNAVKFTPEGGLITINANSDDHFAYVSISDNGLGIEADFLPYVFDRFRQADASLRRKYGGLGLGLSIAKQFIEMHGGEITVSSEGVGRGASFTTQLPRARTNMSATSDSDQTMQSARVNLKGIRILTVDDDADARELTAKNLQAFGAQVEIFESPIDALAQLEAEHYDLLISDIAMPDLDGITLIERLRSFRNADRAKIPAIALSAFSDIEQTRLARASGFNMVMTKPVSAIDLARTAYALMNIRIN